jgi:hypothetical protein|eukprot:SAG25_NODE_23_length_22180_cov_132.152892_12_plen_337_part_00
MPVYVTEVPPSATSSAGPSCTADPPSAKRRRKRRRRTAATAQQYPQLQLAPNELWARWAANRRTLPPEFDRILDPTLSDELRGDLFEMEDEDAQSRYAWAIPNNRALKICEAFQPIVEIGAGAGYWARLLRERGVEVAAFDRDVGPDTRAAGEAGASAWAWVERGGSEQLRRCRFRDSTLLLCFPDDLDFRQEAGDGGAPPSLSLACLQEFSGDTIIHVGEMFGESLTLSMEGQEQPDAPYAWGRSTDPRFQQALVSSFHKIIQLPLPGWAAVRNSLSVWRRTQSCIIDGDRYAHVPAVERLPLAVAAPAFAHLLIPDDDDEVEPPSPSAHPRRLK